jgi:hypothetical protein
VMDGSGGGGLSLRSDDLDSVVELYTHDDLGKMVITVQAMPTRLGRLCELVIPILSKADSLGIPKSPAT